MKKQISLLVLLPLLLVACGPEGGDSGDETSSGGGGAPSIPLEEEHFEMDSKYDSYYDSVSADSTGAVLQRELYEIVKGHTAVSYDSARNHMKQTDRNWELSPNESDSNPYMNLLYSTYSTEAETAVRYNSSVWNREHIWPRNKMNGVDESVASKPYTTDMHALRAADAINNTERSARNYQDMPENGTDVHYIYDAKGNPSGQIFKQNSSDNYHEIGRTSTYEPVDHHKGDVARACFYMATRYMPITGSYDTNLQLISGLSSGGNTLGDLETLLEWHEFDKVDEFEMRRNNIIFEDVQENRNPYIDNPEYAEMVFRGLVDAA